jgi:hypothetical protein
MINKVSRASIRVAPIPSKLSTPFFDCGCWEKEKRINIMNMYKYNFKETHSNSLFFKGILQKKSKQVRHNPQTSMQNPYKTHPT